MATESIERQTTEDISVKGTLHLAKTAVDDVLVFAHGAGGNQDSALLVAIAEQFSAAGVNVFRIDLPFRRRSPRGLPAPARAGLDRAGLTAAVALMRERFGGQVYLGGQSYGGRQSTILAAEDPSIADALLLTSYPLHPPGKPEKLRTAHLPDLRTPSFFVHGTRDNFGTRSEMESALELIPAAHQLHVVEGGGHGLVSKREGPERLQAVMGEIRAAFSAFTNSIGPRSNSRKGPNSGSR